MSFLRYSMSNDIATLKYRSRVNQGLTFHSNHGPISYCVRDIRRFPSKIAKFSHPLVFCARAERVPLGIGYRRTVSKTGVMGLPGRTRSWTITSAVWIECTNVTDGRTDKRTDTGRQQRPRLRIAARGKNRCEAM